MISAEQLEAIAGARNFVEGQAPLLEVIGAIWRVGPLPLCGAFAAVWDTLEQNHLAGWRAVRTDEIDYAGERKWQVVREGKPTELPPDLPKVHTAMFCPAVGGWMVSNSQE